MSEAFKTVEIPNFGPVNFPVTMSDDQVNAAIFKITQSPTSRPAVDKTVESPAMVQGRQADLSMPSKMGLAAAQGLTFNFAPKIAGAGAAGIACLALAGCQTAEQTAGQVAITVGADIGSQLAAAECAKLNKTSAALASDCTTVAGDLIDIATAKARGLIAAK